MQRARDGDALLLAAGELVGHLVRVVRDVEALRSCRPAPPPRGVALLATTIGASIVLEHRVVQEEVVVLEDDAKRMRAWRSALSYVVRDSPGTLAQTRTLP